MFKERYWKGDDSNVYIYEIYRKNIVKFIIITTSSSSSNTWVTYNSKIWKCRYRHLR